MRKLNFWLLSSLFAGVMVFAACSSSDDPEPTPTPTPENPTGDQSITSGTAVNPANMKMNALSGFVYDNEGNPLKDITVTSGTETTVTGGDGGFVLNKVNSVKGRTVVKFTSTSGYRDLVRSMKTVDGDQWEVIMTPNWSTGDDKIYQGTSNAAEPISIDAGGFKVDFPANSIQNPSSYSDYWASLDVLYLDPDDPNFAQAMPGGDLAAVRSDGSDCQLVSYGMSQVEIKVAGYKSQLVEGMPATVTFPVPDKFADDTPDEIPLWSFNEETGLWEEEGIATYNSENNCYVGTVSHFSWVNLDHSEIRTTCRVTVKDEAGNIQPGVNINVDDQLHYITAKNGVAEFFVPINTAFFVSVPSSAYSNYSPEVKVDVAPLALGETKEVTITLPTLARISGKVVNSGKGNNISSLWISYNGKTTKRVHTASEGQFIMNAPANYTGAAVINLYASDGTIKTFDINLDGKDHAYTLNIKTDKATGGSITFTPTNGTAQTSVIPPISAADFNGISEVDGILECSSYSIYLNIEGYSENKDTYTGVHLSYNNGQSLYAENATVKVTKNEYNNYIFDFSGEAKSHTWEGNQYVESTGRIAGQFSAPMLGKGKNIAPITKKESYFPSFTPWIDGKTAISALQVTESSYIGTGVALWFFDNELNYNDYLAYKAQAQKSLGEPFSCSDYGQNPTEEIQNPCVAYFYKDKKFIMVSYCPWRDFDPEYDEPEKLAFFALMENHAGRIQVHALENVSVDFQRMIQETFEHHW